MPARGQIVRIEANGIEFNYRIDGHRGSPWLIFSNSLATNLAMWDRQVEGLRDRFRIVRYDQRGHGETDAPAGHYNFRTLVADVIGLMDALDIPSAHFCGLSMGWMRAMRLAAAHTDARNREASCA